MEYIIIIIILESNDIQSWSVYHYYRHIYRYLPALFIY